MSKSYILIVILIMCVGCEDRNIRLIESIDMRDIQLIHDAGIIAEDIGYLDTSDIYEPPLRLIFEPDNPKPLFGEVALIPSMVDEKFMVIDMLLGGDNSMKLSFYGLYYRLSFPDDVLEVETISAHPEFPPGIINKFTVRRGEIIGVITNKGESPNFLLSCKKPLVSIRFKIKMVRAGRIDIVTSKTNIVDDKLMPVINNYYGGRLSIVQK
ncbi:MAG: hypothetical protein N2746_07705 [Deltaproteobacteria bacterium]|nr:hypothetical protein [Deltaproteobacteria bacterium]